MTVRHDATEEEKENDALRHALQVAMFLLAEAKDAIHPPDPWLETYEKLVERVEDIDRG